MTTAHPFDFLPPRGYLWLIERGLVGFGPHTALQPWYFVAPGHVIDLSELWPNGPSQSRLVVFARRQDCDDMARFEIAADDTKKVVLVHGWTSPEGYDILETYDDVWGWLKTVIDNVADWVGSGESAD